MSQIHDHLLQTHLLSLPQLSQNIPIFAPDAPLQLVLHSVDAIKTLPALQQVGVIHAYVVRPI
jgi:hypothetical protein